MIAENTSSSADIETCLLTLIDSDEPFNVFNGSLPFFSPPRISQNRQPLCSMKICQTCSRHLSVQFTISSVPTNVQAGIVKNQGALARRLVSESAESETSCKKLALDFWMFPNVKS